MIRTSTVVLTGLIVALACGPGLSSEANNPGSQGIENSAPDASTRRIASAGNAFACDLYGRLAAGPGNRFMSPVSITSCLGMALAGADGETRDQIADVLHVGAMPPPEVHRGFGELAEAVLRDGNRSDDKGKFNWANGVWIHRSRGLLPRYRETIREHYRGDIRKADFILNRSGAAREINRWVDRQTEGEIPRIVDASDFTLATRLLLANAVYFKGQWASRFEEAATRDEPFHRFIEPTDESAPSNPVPLMHQVQDFLYTENADMQMVVLPYRGERLAMVVCLPTAADPERPTQAEFAAMEKELTAENLEAWLAACLPHRVDLSLPRFEFTDMQMLNGVLSELGMKNAFDSGEADFSAIDGRGDLFIQWVRHVARVRVDEEGTVAAAATGMSFGCGAAAPSPPPAVFRADRPFLFMICHVPSRAILFIGRVTTL